MGFLFGYLQMLRTVGPQQWIFDELAAIANLKFRFAEEEDACEYVARIAADMPHYAPEHALCGPHLYDTWDPSLVRKLQGYSSPIYLKCTLTACIRSGVVTHQCLIGCRSTVC